MHVFVTLHFPEIHKQRQSGVKKLMTLKKYLWTIYWKDQGKIEIKIVITVIPKVETII